jgi:hypothetical protein
MIVGILGPGGCGGTFLDWSIHFLRGDIKHYTVSCGGGHRSKIVDQGYTPICSNPLTGTNAHGHQKTHPNNDSLGMVIEIFSRLSQSDLHTFYYVDSMRSDQTQTTHNKIIATYRQCLFLTYQFQPSDIDKIYCYQVEKDPAQCNMYDQFKSWSDLPIWDQREILSLYYPNCIQGQTTAEIIKNQNNNFCINFSDILTCLDLVMLDILDFLSVKLAQDRWCAWTQVYQQWKTKNSLDFFADLDKIVDSILNGLSYDLAQYNMTFAKEVVLASKLLYNHNKALKSFSMAQMPTNTLDWYSILEENTYHDLHNLKRKQA